MKKRAIIEYFNDRMHKLVLDRHELDKEIAQIRYILDYLIDKEDKCTDDDSESMEGMFSHLQSEKASDLDNKNKEAKQNKLQER